MDHQTPVRGRRRRLRQRREFCVCQITSIETFWLQTCLYHTHDHCSRFNAFCGFFCLILWSHCSRNGWNSWLYRRTRVIRLFLFPVKKVRQKVVLVKLLRFFFCTVLFLPSSILERSRNCVCTHTTGRGEKFDHTEGRWACIPK